MFIFIFNSHENRFVCTHCYCHIVNDKTYEDNSGPPLDYFAKKP